MSLLSRRAAIASVPVGAVAAHQLLQTTSAPDEGSTPVQGEAAARSLLEHVAPGTVLGAWKVTDARSFQGAVVVSLAGEGQAFDLEVHARDDRPEAVLSPASTRSLAIFVKNGAGGALQTDEEQGLAALTLAAHLERHEHAGLAEGLVTFAERSRHPRVVRMA